MRKTTTFILEKAHVDKAAKLLIPLLPPLHWWQVGRYYYYYYYYYLVTRI